MPEPEFAPIPIWLIISGISRTGTYDALAEGWLEAIKVGRRTLIVVKPGLAALRARPKATFGKSNPPKTSAVPTVGWDAGRSVLVANEHARGVSDEMLIDRQLIAISTEGKRQRGGFGPTAPTLGERLARKTGALA